MNTKNYKNIDKFIYDVLGKYEEIENKTDEEDFTGINIVAHYDTILAILNDLVKNTDFEMEFIEISEPDWDGYCDEFILTIDNNGHIHCQKTIYDGQKDYIFVDEFTFVSADTNSKFVVRNKDIPMIEFSIGKDEDECDYTCKCKSDCKEYSSKDEDGNNFHITIKGDLDLDEAYAKLDEVETRMLRMSEMFDEMHSFSRLLGFRI